MQQPALPPRTHHSVVFTRWRPPHIYASLIPGYLGPCKSVRHRAPDQFSHFCRVYQRDQHTDIQTDCATSKRVKTHICRPTSIDGSVG